MSQEQAEYGVPGKKPKAWEQQPDESNLWFDRFVKFLLYGSSRSLDQCYRDVVGDEKAAKGRERPRESARAPASWKKQAKTLDWWGRAEAWDADQRVQAVKRVAEALDLARFHAQEAVQFQIDLMRGEAKQKSGETADGQDVHQRRLAANSILNRSGVVHDGLDVDDDGAVQVIGIRVQQNRQEE